MLPAPDLARAVPGVYLSMIRLLSKRASGRASRRAWWVGEFEGVENAAGIAGRTRSRAGCRTSGSRQARPAERPRTQGAVALDLDDPQREPPAAEPGRAQGRRSSGIERVGGDADDGALSRCVAAAGPGGGQAACGTGVPRAALPAGTPDPRQARTLPRFGRRAILSVAHQGRRYRRSLDRIGWAGCR